MKKIIVLFVIITILNSQTYNTIHDARTVGMAGATTALKDNRMPSFSNPASLAYTDQISAYVNVASPYSYFDVIKIGALNGVYPLQDYGGVSLTTEFFQVNYQGHVLSSENNFVLSHGLKIMEDVSTSLSFGYNIHFYQLIFNNFEGKGGSESTFQTLFDFGMMATLYKNVTLGAFVKNINNRKVGLENNRELLRQMQVGIAYTPYQGVVTTFDLSKELGYDNRYHFGLEFDVISTDLVAAELRLGVVSDPNQFAFGFGFEKDQYRLDYGAITHPISITHQVGFTYVFE